MKKSVFFLHIPKTAGTSINEVFRPVFEEVRFFDHCESRKQELLQNLAAEDEPFFASGHLRFVNCADLVANKKVFSMTVLRRPEQQLESHLNWVKAYGDPNAVERRRMIEPAIAELSTKLWSANLNDISEMRILMSQPVAMRLFDNMQTRYLRDVHHDLPVTSNCLLSAISSFKFFDLAFTLDDYRSAVKMFSKTYGVVDELRPQNVQKTKQKINLERADIAEFYEPFIRFDRKLFNHLKRYSQVMFSQFNNSLSEDSK